MDWIKASDKMPTLDDGLIFIYLPEKLESFKDNLDTIQGVVVVEISKAPQRFIDHGFAQEGDLVMIPHDGEWTTRFPLKGFTHWMPWPDPPKD